MCKSTLSQEEAAAIATSLQVSWNQTKANKPFADAEFMRKHAIDYGYWGFETSREEQKRIVELLMQVSLSTNTATRQLMVLVKECFFQSHLQFQNAEIFLTIGSSYDHIDIRPVSAFLRFFD